MVVAVGFLIWVGVTLLLWDRQLRRERPSLAERLEPYYEPGVAVEAERWLQEMDR